MRIVDVWKQDSAVFAYCIGKEINSKFSCKEISINGKRYGISAFDVLTALNGTTNVVLKIDNAKCEEIPLGNFRIAS